MRDGDLTHRGDAPLPVDLFGHFKEVGRALLPALVIALIVGGAVFFVSATFTPKEYSATIFTQITSTQTPVPGDAYVEQARAPFLGLALDSNVLNQVLSQTDTGWDAETLQSHVTLSSGPAPQLLFFTATAGSPQLAREVAEAMVATVAQAAQANYTRDVGKQLEQVQATIAAEEASTATLAPEDPARAVSDRRLADLRAQLDTLQRSSGDRLNVLATPQQSLEPVAPQPLEQSLVAGVAALVIAAELIVAYRSRVGSKPNRTWARRLSHRYSAGFDPRRSTELPTLAAAEIARQAREGGEVLVLLGRGAKFVNPEAPSERNSSGHRRTLTEQPLDSPWWRDLDTDSIGVALVIVSTGSADRKLAGETLRQLAALGVPRWLILQYGTRPAKSKGAKVTAAKNGTGNQTPVAAPGTPPRGTEHDVR